MNAFSNLRIVQSVEKWQFERVQTRLKHAEFSPDPDRVGSSCLIFAAVASNSGGSPNTPPAHTAPLSSLRSLPARKHPRQHRRRTTPRILHPAPHKPRHRDASRPEPPC